MVPYVSPTHREFPVEPSEAAVHGGGLARVRRHVRPLAERVRLRQPERVRRREGRRRQSQRRGGVVRAGVRGSEGTVSTCKLGKAHSLVVCGVDTLLLSQMSLPASYPFSQMSATVVKESKAKKNSLETDFAKGVVGS